MAKLVALLATLLLVAHTTAASSFRVTTTTFDDERSYSGGGYYSGSEQCRREVQSRNLRPCMQFLTEQEQDLSHLRHGGADVSLGGRGSHSFYRCCDELKAIEDYQCRCDALRMQVQKLTRGPQGEEEMAGHGRAMVGTAETLPRMCGIGPETCRFQSSRWF